MTLNIEKHTTLDNVTQDDGNVEEVYTAPDAGAVFIFLVGDEDGALETIKPLIRDEEEEEISWSDEDWDIEKLVIYTDGTWDAELHVRAYSGWVSFVMEERANVSGETGKEIVTAYEAEVTQ